MYIKNYLVLVFAFFQHFFGYVITNLSCDNGTEPLNENLICSGLAQCRDCSDETNCPGSKDFVSCQDSIFATTKCINPDLFCDNTPHCSNCFDEINCSNTSGIFFCDDRKSCVDFNVGDDVCRRNEPLASCPYFCDSIPHCDDNSDEKEVGFGFKCSTINSLNKDTRCLVPQRYLGMSGGDRHVICADAADKCFTIAKDTGLKVFDPLTCWTCLDGTIIQRHQVCDNVFDCPDLSDECLCFRNTINICESFLSNRENCTDDQVSCGKDAKCINVTQMCNEFPDCADGSDERFCTRDSCAITEEEFKCDNRTGRLRENDIPIACNGVPECVFAEDECNESCGDDIPGYCNDIFPNTVPNVKCINGTSDVHIEELCNKVRDCDNGYDEKDCKNLQLCDANNASSRRYDVRPCGPDRCNLDAVCDNLMDELNCPENTHFYCDENQKFIPQWQRFDGIFDCADFSDECNSSGRSISSSRELIKNVPLRVCLWILMLLSLIGNGIVICRTLIDLSNAVQRRLHCSINRVGVCNKIMILNLAISDFLMGIYLFIIAIKSVELSGRYCQLRQEWLTGYQCAFAGVLAVISSETSVFLMVLMTSYRLYGITSPFRAERIRGREIFLATVIIWILSLFLGTIPVFPSLQANFASSVFLSQPYSGNLLTRSDVSQIFNKVDSLPGVNSSIPDVSELSVSTFCNLFVNRESLPDYCDNPDKLKNVTAGYYGSDGVCLPRYYGRENEPASQYSIAIITLNFAAFLYMFFAYLFIYRSTSVDVQQGDAHSSSMDENRSKENQALWGKIVRLIVTDLICWIPICIMSFISFAGYIIPDVVYPITAILLVPINSAANPWLYSSFLAEYVRRLYQYVKGVCLQKKQIKTKETNTSTRQKTYARFRRRNGRKASMESSMTYSVRLSTTGINPPENGNAAHSSSPA